MKTHNIITTNRQQLDNLLGMRCLIQLTNQNAFYSKNGVEEIKILEFSPTGNWIKIMRIQGGQKFWTETANVGIVEELPNLFEYQRKNSELSKETK